MVYSGMGPDYRVLVKRARKAAEEYMLYHGSEIPTAQLVKPHFKEFSAAALIFALTALGLRHQRTVGVFFNYLS